DEMSVLGESYEMAVKRFLDEGLLEILEPKDSLRRGLTIENLRNLASENGLVLTGRKNVMVNQFVSELRPEVLNIYLDKMQYYRLTSRGLASLHEEETAIEDAKQRVKNN